ncbi:MAG TPA: glycosyltransferase [Phototrophicaceae bacterium]|jgi:glycosyltransferase involved in cell wall biosynthesis|nr:glycosyltransferase [Phototrophicaceae bacterium]
MPGIKTLLITASLPYPPASGGAIRVYGILKGLHAAGHHITLMAFTESQDDSIPLVQFCQQIITLPAPHRSISNRLRDLLLSRQPDIAGRLYSEDFATRLRELLSQEKFDLIQIEAIEVASYLPIAKAAQPEAKLVFDTFNAEYLLQRVIFQIDRQDIKRLPAALYSLIQAGRIERFEREMCQLADAVIAVSPEDADALRGFREDHRIHIVPSGIFVDDYQSNNSGSEIPNIASSTPRLVFTGKMDYRPNVDAMLWFTEAILPQIQQQIPDIRLYIVGQKPHLRLDVLRDNPAITLTGWVDSVQPYLDRAAVYVAPLRMGSGTRLKLLEAMAAGCAIVATTIAAAGMLDETREAMLIADTVDELAAAIVKLLQNPELRRTLREAARRAVRDHYDWSVIIPRLTAMYGELGLG